MPIKQLMYIITFKIIRSTGRLTDIAGYMSQTVPSHRVLTLSEVGLCNGRASVVCPSACPVDRQQQRRTEVGRGQQISIDICRRRVPAIDQYLLHAPELRMRVVS